MQAEIYSRLQVGSPEAIREAGRLCENLAARTAYLPEHTEHLVLQTAFALEQLGDIEAAGRLYGHIMNCELADSAPRANASYRYGLLQEVAGRISESVSALELALDLATDPLIAQVARQRLASVMARNGRMEQALLHLDVLLAEPGLNAAQALPYALQRLRVLLKLNQTGLQPDDLLMILPPGGSVIDEMAIGPWMEAAMALEFEQKYALAKDFYFRLQQMRGLPPRDRTNCHFRLGLMFEHLSQWKSSTLHYRMAVDAPPDFPEAQAQARFHLAELLYLSEDYEAAMEHLIILGSLPELNASQRLETKFRLGVCLFRQGQLDEAVREFESCRGHVRETDNGLGSKVDLYLAEIFELRNEVAAACREYERIIGNPHTEPVIKSSALARLHQLRHNRKGVPK